MTSSTPRRSLLLATTLAATVLAAGLAGCSPRLDVRGNSPDEEAVLAVQPGEYTKEQVAQVLGTPSTVATFDQNTWYYIGSRTETTAFFDADILDQQILAIKFDDGGYVSDMRLYGAEDATEVIPVGEITPTHGRKLNILQQIFGNIGRFSDTLDTKPKATIPGQ